MVICVIFQVDIQLETGEYFMSDKKKSAKKWQERQEKQAEKTAENKRKRDQSFIPPKVFCCFSLLHKNLCHAYCFIISFLVFNQTSIYTFFRNLQNWQITLRMLIIMYLKWQCP
jgi:hypothetical protein